MISDLSDYSKRSNLEMNKTKTKIMNNIEEDTHKSLEGTLLEKVDNYFDPKITTKRNQDQKDQNRVVRF